jgi:hypothetical protein
MITNIYDFVEAIASDLAKAGEKRWSANLEAALSISTVPSEILGATAQTLRNFKASGVADQYQVAERVEVALQYFANLYK